MKRLGQPSEIVDTVAFWASDVAGYITGETVVVDGERTLNYTVAVGWLAVYVLKNCSCRRATFCMWNRP